MKIKCIFIKGFLECYFDFIYFGIFLKGLANLDFTAFSAFSPKTHSSSFQTFLESQVHGLCKANYPNYPSCYYNLLSSTRPYRRTYISVVFSSVKHLSRFLHPLKLPE